MSKVMFLILLGSLLVDNVLLFTFPEHFLVIAASSLVFLVWFYLLWAYKL